MDLPTRKYLKNSRCECKQKKKKKHIKNKKATKLFPLSKHHKDKSIYWSQSMKGDFSLVIFSGECRTTVEEPNGWDTGWLLNGNSYPI